MTYDNSLTWLSSVDLVDHFQVEGVTIGGSQSIARFLVTLLYIKIHKPFYI